MCQPVRKARDMHGAVLTKESHDHSIPCINRYLPIECVVLTAKPNIVATVSQNHEANIATSKPVINQSSSQNVMHICKDLQGCVLAWWLDSMRFVWLVQCTTQLGACSIVRCVTCVLLVHIHSNDRAVGIHFSCQQAIYAGCPSIGDLTKCKNVWIVLKILRPCNVAPDGP